MFQSKDKVFYTFELEDPQPTSWVHWPTTEKPSNKFKYASFDIYFSSDKQVWFRTTYSFFDWLGDLGGLYNGFTAVIGVLVEPLAAL